MRRAAVVSALRTPVGSFGGSLRTLAADQLVAQVIQALMTRTGIDPAALDEVVVAQAYASSEAPCIARYAALAAGLPLDLPGYSVDRRCGSGLQAVIDASMLVQTGAADVAFAFLLSTRAGGLGIRHHTTRMNHTVVAMAHTPAVPR